MNDAVIVVTLAAVVVVAAAEAAVAAAVMVVEVMTVETTVVPPCEWEGASASASTSGTASGWETTATDASSGTVVWAGVKSSFMARLLSSIQVLYGMLRWEEGGL